MIEWKTASKDRATEQLASFVKEPAGTPSGLSNTSPFFFFVVVFSSQPGAFVLERDREKCPAKASRTGNPTTTMATAPSYDGLFASPSSFQKIHTVSTLMLRAGEME